ncbi:MAG: TusE/DsrC/DsvC family sulfur relay protein, partial [Verrucomicrobia bacterium]|nr:TusE/DsrC/DsvC family sulfur relay protein [Verrucomicrobiota bacterium]
MPTREIAGTTVEVNEEGYFTNSDQWSEAMATVIAQEDGLGELTDGHWKVINFLRQDYKEKGTMPTVRRVKNAGGIPTKDLYDLFPGGPLKKSSKIAGL